jgi:hypothetical protein
MATNAEKLVEAEAAYHSLMLGGAVVEVTDQNGEKVRYDRAKKSDLLQYIADLRNLIALEGGGVVRSGPLRMIF